MGSDFRVPPAPPVSGYTPDTPTTTVFAQVAAGAAQHFGIGRDIPAEWWKVFHSNEVDALIAEALHANPNLQAAQATLWQAKETLYSLGAGSFCRRSTGTHPFRRSNLAGRIRPIRFAAGLYAVSSHGDVRGPDVFGGQRRQIEANAALAEYQRFELEATYLTLTSNVVTAAVQEASLRGQIEATQLIIKAQTDQLVVVRHQFEAGAANRADVLTQESEVATTEATLPPLRKQLEQQHKPPAVFGWPLSE